VNLGDGSEYWISTNDSAESLGTSVYDTFKWSDLNGSTTLPRTGVKITPAATNNGLHGTFYVWHHIVEGMYPTNGITSRDHYYFIGYEGTHDPPIAFNTPMPFEVTLSFNTNANNGGLDADLSGMPGNKMTVGQSNSTRWMLGTPISNASTQALGNTGVGKINFTPQHLARYYFIMNSANIGMDEEASKTLRVFPNPSDGTLKIEAPSEVDFLEYEIFSQIGKSVALGRLEFSEANQTLVLPNELANGTYYFITSLGIAVFELAR
jgi:hypothetical protein